jgi:hypothetical protein
MAVIMSEGFESSRDYLYWFEKNVYHKQNHKQKLLQSGNNIDDEQFVDELMRNGDFGTLIMRYRQK